METLVRTTLTFSTHTYLEMDWKWLAAVNVFQLERNESLLDSLYAFLEKNELSAAEAARAEPGQLAKILSVVQRIMKVEKALQQQLCFP